MLDVVLVPTAQLAGHGASPLWPAFYQMENHKIEFVTPEGLTLPEGTQPGDKVELMAEFQVKPDGRMCIVSIEGAAMPGYGKMDMPEKKEMGKDMEPESGEGFMDRYNSYKG